MMVNMGIMGWYFVAFVAVLVPVSLCQTTEGDMPREIIECVQLSENYTIDSSVSYSTNADTFARCLQLFIWKYETVQWKAFNITEEDKAFINSLIGSYVHRGRKKRQTGPGGPRRIFPETGFRVRREYRRLSDGERFAFHAAINQMKMSGQYNTFANLHQGMVVTSAHGGPNFLGWHRVYLALVEEALRRINPRLSLPYWDSTLDFDMENPANSIIWSTPFLGNGDGFVTTGPFANWETPVGRLTRNVAAGSRLFSREVIRAILSRCRVRDISDPTAQDQFNLELAHGGPHVWVGGQMSGLNTAAHDPVFFLHHAFVDYIWEMFRIRQARFCRVNPSRDYPPTMGEHAAMRPMDGFPQYRNIDGYQSYWTRFWYRYERSPSCSGWRPFCGTPYLRCDVRRRRCVSVARMGPAPMGTAGIAGARMTFAANQPQTMASVMRARTQSSMINVGRRFRAPPPEPRTQDAQRMMGGMRRRFRRAVNQLDSKNSSGKVDFKPQQMLDFGPTFAAPPSDGRTSDTFRGSSTRVDPTVEHTLPGALVFPSSDPEPLLPSSEYHESHLNIMPNTPSLNTPSLNTPSLNTPIQTTLNPNGQSNISSDLVFIPVRVTYINNHQSRSFRFSENNKISQTAIDNRCTQDASGVVRIKVQSNGLNYYGTFTDYAFIDGNLPVGSTVTYIGIKSPESSRTEVLLTAVHSCGLSCQAHCAIPYSNLPSFQPCSGVLNITSSMFGSNYMGAVWPFDRMLTNNVRVAFRCSSTDVSLWPGFSQNLTPS